MIEVKNRTPESWGPLASLPETRFNQIIGNRRSSTKDMIKEEVKRAKKLKTYKVSFKKEWVSDVFEIQAENEYAVRAKAREYFKENADSIGFKEKSRGKWASDYVGFDSISYVKARS